MGKFSASVVSPKSTWYKRRREADTYILVNGKIIGRNAKKHENEPPIVVKEGKNSHNCHELEINGRCRIVYTGVGCRVWGAGE